MARKKKRRRKIAGIYLLPTMMTLVNLGAGFYALVLGLYSALHPGDPRWGAACWAIVVALLMDGLDGRIARMTATTSTYGVQLDSLADLVSFGVAPALLVYLRWLTVTPKLGWTWIMALAYVTGGAMRLARFNIQSSEEEAKGFIGLPIPAAASVLISFMMFYDDLPEVFSRWINEATLKMSFPFVLFILGYLMFSYIRFPSFKDINLRRKHPLGALVPITLLLALLLLQPYITFFVGSMVYLLLPIARRLLRSHHRLAADIIADVDEDL